MISRLTRTTLLLSVLASLMACSVPEYDSSDLQPDELYLSIDSVIVADSVTTSLYISKAGEVNSKVTLTGTDTLSVLLDTTPVTLTGSEATRSGTITAPGAWSGNVLASFNRGGIDVANISLEYGDLLGTSFGYAGTFTEINSDVSITVSAIPSSSTTVNNIGAYLVCNSGNLIYTLIYNTLNGTTDTLDIDEAITDFNTSQGTSLLWADLVSNPCILKVTAARTLISAPTVTTFGGYRVSAMQSDSDEITLEL